MGEMASQITTLTIVYSTVYSGAGQRKHQSSASLAFVPGIHQWPVNSPHKWPVTRKMFPFDDVIMLHTPKPICISWLINAQMQLHYSFWLSYSIHFIDFVFDCTRTRRDTRLPYNQDGIILDFTKNSLYFWFEEFSHKYCTCRNNNVVELCW